MSLLSKVECFWFPFSTPPDIAYPVFLNEYEDDRMRSRSPATVECQTCGVVCQISIVRNGEFDLLLTEDVYWRSIAQMESALPTVKSRVHELAGYPSTTLPL